MVCQWWYWSVLEISSGIERFLWQLHLQTCTDNTSEARIINSNILCQHINFTSMVGISLQYFNGSSLIRFGSPSSDLIVVTNRTFHVKQLSKYRVTIAFPNKKIALPTRYVYYLNLQEFDYTLSESIMFVIWFRCNWYGNVSEKMSFKQVRIFQIGPMWYEYTQYINIRVEFRITSFCLNRLKRNHKRSAMAC